MSREMTFLEHLEELRVRVVRILLTIGAVTVFSFVFSIKEFRIGDVLLLLPFPDPRENLASQVIARVRQDVLPPFVQLTVIAPGQAIIAQLYVSIFLGILIGMPIIARETGGFVNPALYPRERKLIVRLLFPATLLFALGSLFSYLFIVSFTLDFLYGYAAASGVDLPLITIDGLMGFVFLFVAAFGLTFQLPIIMWVVTGAGLVDSSFWIKNLRYAFVAMVIFGALITPDGSGITMWLVALPMTGLYLLGYLAVKLKVKPSVKS